MDLFRVVFLIYLGVASIECPPPKTKLTMYDVVVQTCPSVQNLTNFKEQLLFNSCSDWDRINNTQKLTDDTKNDVLCLLYFHSFSQYCNRTKEPSTDLSDVDMKVNMSAICDNQDIIPIQTEPDAALHKLIATKQDCKKLCIDSFGLAMPMCAISYHYSHVPAAPAPSKNSPHLIPITKPATKLPAVVAKSKGDVDSKPETKTVEDQNNLQQTTTPETKNEGDSPPQSVDVNTNGRADGATNDPVKAVQTVVAEEGGVNKVYMVNKEQEEKVEKQKPPPETLAPPKNDDSVNEVNDQLEKHAEEGAPDGGGDLNNDAVIVEGEVAQPNNDNFSEEDAEEPSSPLEKNPKPMQTDETDAVSYATEMDGDSYFFTYFMLLCVIFVVGYVCYHNKQKILALMLEGRRGKRQYRGRRPNSANYHKLDSNLEEAITSSCNKNTNNVIY